MVTSVRAATAPLARLPYPVASPLAQARSLSGADQHERAATVARVTLRYCAGLLLADALRGPLDAGVEPWVGALSAPSAATWGDLIASLAASLHRRPAPRSFARSAAAWAADISGRKSPSLERLVEIADAGLGPLADVESLLAEAGWLCEHRVVRVLTAGATPRGGQEGMLQPLEGSSELTEPIVAEWKPPLAVDGVYATTADFASALDLRPFVEVIYDPASVSELCYLFEAVPDLVRVAWCNDASGRRVELLVRTAHGEMAWTQWRTEAASQGRFLGAEPTQVAAAAQPAPPPAARPAPAEPPRVPEPDPPVPQRPAAAAMPPADLADRPTGLMPAFRPTEPPKTPQAQRRISVGDGTLTKAGMSSEVFGRRPARGPLPDTDEVALPTLVRRPPPPPAEASTQAVAPLPVAPATPMALGPSAEALIESLVSCGADADAELGALWHVLAPARPAAAAAPSPAAARLAPPPRAPQADGRSLAEHVAAAAAAVASAAPSPAPTPRPAQHAAPSPAEQPSSSPLASFLGSSPRAASGPLATGARIGNRYVIERSLEGGHLARLFVATDEILHRRVLLRVPDPRFSADPTFRQRFEAESRELMRFEHPHVAKVLDLGEEGGRPFAVLQALEGGTLEDRLRAGGVTARRVLDWLAHVAEALDAVHQLGSVHRDVEPRNILFDQHENAYLADFGVARAIGQEWNRMTHAGVLPAAPAYMAPEAVREIPPTPQYDQYSLAIIAFRAFSGQLPHVAPSPMALLLIRPKTPARPLSSLASVPQAASDALARALEIEPDRRFPSCATFVKAVRGAYERARRLDEPVPALLQGGSGAPAERPIAQARPTAQPPAEPRREARPPARAVGDIDDLDGAGEPAAAAGRSRAGLVLRIAIGVVVVFALGIGVALLIRRLS